MFWFDCSGTDTHDPDEIEEQGVLASDLSSHVFVLTSNCPFARVLTLIICFRCICILQLSKISYALRRTYLW